MFNINFHRVISRRSHELGDNPTQMDTEPSFNQCYQKILTRFCQYYRPAETFPYLFPQHTACTGSRLQFPAIVKPFAVLWDRKQANRKCVKHPVPTLAQAKAFYYSKSCGFFQKDDSTNARNVPLDCPLLSFCQIIGNMTWNNFPALLSGMPGYQRFGVLKPWGSLAAELCTTKRIFFLFASNIKYTGCGKCHNNSPKYKYQTYSIIFSYLCKEEYSCICSLQHHQCTSPGWGRGWRRIRLCLSDSLVLL